MNSLWRYICALLEVGVPKLTGRPLFLLLPIFERIFLTNREYIDIRKFRGGIDVLCSFIERN